MYITSTAELFLQFIVHFKVQLLTKNNNLKAQNKLI